MLYRKIIKSLEKWHSLTNKKALLLTGARQVGKQQQFHKTSCRKSVRCPAIGHSIRAAERRL